MLMIFLIDEIIKGLNCDNKESQQKALKHADKALARIEKAKQKIDHTG